MRATVLADLQISEMEAEGLRLPDELVQLAIRLAWRAGVGKRRLERSKVVEQFLGPRACEGEIAATCRRDALGAQQEELPVRLTRCACLDGDGPVADDVSSGAEPAEKAVVGWRALDVGRETGADSRGCGFQPAEDVLRLDEQCLARDLGGDLRVAVAVAADPAAEAEKRGSARGPRAIVAGERSRELAVDGR